MNRVAAFIAAASFLAVPAIAGSYSAKPVTAPTTNKIIGKDISWVCAGGTCRGSTEESRPLILCHRETPLSLIDIRNKEQLTLAGAIVCPTNSGFYL